MSSQDEREHCEAVVARFMDRCLDGVGPGDLRPSLADMIERERAAAREQGRAEALDLLRPDYPDAVRMLEGRLSRTGGSNG